MELALEDGGQTTATLYPSDTTARAILALAHGAGAGQGHPFMVHVARGLAGRGIDVVTFDFPYMHQKRKMPDKAPVLEACFRTVLSTVKDSGAMEGRRLFIGGKSMGGRMATHLAAQGVENLAGTVAFGYPLHPPGKREQLRTAHLPSITAPLLIVQGERDTFGTPDELAPVIAAMRAPTKLFVVKGGDHSLGVRTRGRGEVLAEVLDVVAAWMLSPRVH